MIRQCMRCDAPPFSPTDYDYIMQCAEKRPRDEVLKKLTDKYHTSQKRIYQIWRGEEKNRIAWNQPINRPILSLSGINDVDRQTGPDTQDQGVVSFANLENIIRDASVEPSKSTDSASDGGVILGSKKKKTGGRKPRPKSVTASEPPVLQTYPTPIRGDELKALYEKEFRGTKKN